MTNFIRRLRADTLGAAAIEFALIGPAFIVMMLGVLQVGMGLQSYNAMRNLSADVARYSMVQYQTGNAISNSQIRTWTRNHAKGAPYMLDPDRLGVTIRDASTQRVADAKELEIIVTYQITSVLEFIDIDGPTLDFERPVFLLEP
ncbi:TadE family protein [Erythrobacter alti]|uniref:TadE family protein n=1 Tax=Erythrobacter alti TaxID=1896145 RepID=UPI0030F48CD4